LRIAKGNPNKLSEMRPNDAAYFAQRYDAFEQRSSQSDQQWLAQMKPYVGRKSLLITVPGRISPNISPSTWSAYVEPRPGIPPALSTTVELIGLMKRDGVKSSSLSHTSISKRQTASHARRAGKLSS